MGSGDEKKGSKDRDGRPPKDIVGTTTLPPEEREAQGGGLRFVPWLPDAPALSQGC